jgi:hypothetical protein
VRNRLVIVAAAALATTACSRPRTDDSPFQWTSELPAGTVLHLRDGAGNIVVRRAAAQTASVSGSRRWQRSRARDIQFVVTRSGNDYYLCAMWRSSGRCAANGYRGRQTNGFLTMFSLLHRNNDAFADLTAEIPANVVVDASTRIGSVEIDGMTAGVTAHSTTGAVQASNVSGPVSLTTITGNVRLSTDSLAASDEIRLLTTNGTIHAELPANLEGKFDLSVLNGTVRSDLDVPPTSQSRRGRHLQGQIGSSTRVVKMHTVNGTVTLLTRGAAVAH